MQELVGVEGSGSELSGREKAYLYVRDQVLTSPAATGSFLNEQELATRIGVSRTPVREALLMLQAEGLVEMVPKRGAHVPAMSGRQIAELMELRGVLERHAASRALEVGQVPIAAMRSALAAQEAIATGRRADDARTFIDWDGRFHQILIDSAGSDLLTRTYAGLRARQLRVGLTALGASDRQHGVCVEHQAIIDALDVGDEALVHEKINAHLEFTLQILLRA
ncbi:GntR family transcriptional regulator [Antrihabitans cavernicola]|uniref:GntR family transcriptional regulator n=1 Tax=Antrihabitans cavernicola TaxID=2495913 RepID=A0A5A7SCJ1_9NOCA|nr:GntR family transcriptional regulator [Spelaeibacter cavernicola]KAA0022313.1 GntR family transcriptional regulator [Spelaeibacter cavernicola]